MFFENSAESDAVKEESSSVSVPMEDVEDMVDVSELREKTDFVRLKPPPDAPTVAVVDNEGALTSARFTGE